MSTLADVQADPEARPARHGHLADPAPVSAAVVVGLVGWLVAAFGAVIASTPYRGDDVVNSQVHENLASVHWTLWHAIVFNTTDWMEHQGRFFPGSVSWTLSVFYVADTHAAYKLVLVATLALALLTAALLVGRASRAWSGGVVTAVLLLGLVQIRVWADAYTAFSGLLTLTTAATLAAVVLVLRSGRWWAALGAALLYSGALLTYETVILFVPPIVLLVIVLTRRWRRALAFVVPAVLQAAWVLFLRSRMVGVAPAYQVALVPGDVLRTTARQMVAALPLSQWWLHADGVPPITVGALAVTTLLAGVPAAVCVYLVAGRRRRAPGDAVPRGGAWTVVVLGIWMWVSSSVLVGMTLRWQQSVELGQGYLPVVYGQVGLALAGGAVWRVLDARVPSTRARAWRLLSGALVGLLVALTLAGNLAAVSAESLT
ncbi:MAG: hypothetical protein HGA44_09830 [Cellulomonadaceae bacterium]|nr:hypothetical protein [Cellulomonadaceae bacterium]